MTGFEQKYSVGVQCQTIKMTVRDVVVQYKAGGRRWKVCERKKKANEKDRGLF